MAAGDLATLNDVKSWLGLAPSETTSDAVLSRLITATSGVVRSRLNRFSLVSRSCLDLRDGSGTQSFLLRHWPVTSVQQVKVWSAIVPQSTLVSGNPSAGWTLSTWDGYPPGSHQTLTLAGYIFDHGSKNVAVSYTAGYLVPSEAAVVPSLSFRYQVLAPLGSWSADNGVVYGDTGVALVLVAGTPTTGQYSLPTVPSGSQPGIYQFAAADVGRPVLISYSYTPADLEQVIVEWVSERFSYRSRIGQRSKSLGGQETMSWDLSGIPNFVDAAIQPYIDVVPLPP